MNLKNNFKHDFCKESSRGWMECNSSLSSADEEDSYLDRKNDF